jgi:hypothetical protein
LKRRFLVVRKRKKGFLMAGLIRHYTTLAMVTGHMNHHVTKISIQFCRGTQAVVVVL